MDHKKWRGKKVSEGGSRRTRKFIAASFFFAFLHVDLTLMDHISGPGYEFNLEEILKTKKK